MTRLGPTTIVKAMDVDEPIRRRAFRETRRWIKEKGLGPALAVSVISGVLTWFLGPQPETPSSIERVLLSALVAALALLMCATGIYLWKWFSLPRQDSKELHALRRYAPVIVYGAPYLRDEFTNRHGVEAPDLGVLRLPVSLAPASPGGTRSSFDITATVAWDSGTSRTGRGWRRTRNFSAGLRRRHPE